MTRIILESVKILHHFLLKLEGILNSHLDEALWMLVFRAFSLRLEQINVRLSI